MGELRRGCKLLCRILSLILLLIYLTYYGITNLCVFTQIFLIFLHQNKSSHLLLSVGS